MKTSKKFSSALIISSLFLSTSLVAQAQSSEAGRSERTAPLDNEKGTKPLDNEIGTKPIDNEIGTKPIDSGVVTAPLDNEKGTQPLEDLQSQDVYQAARKGSGYIRNDLHLVIEGHDFSIRGGEAGEACAILVGLELQAVPLPGGDELKIAPLAVVAQGRFDEFGEFSVMIGYDAKMVARVAYHLQAVSYEEMSGKFWTSNVETLDFSEPGPAGMRAPRKGDEDATGDYGDDDSHSDSMRAPRKGDEDATGDYGDDDSHTDSMRAPGVGDADATGDYNGDDNSGGADGRMKAPTSEVGTVGLDDTVGTHN